MQAKPMILIHKERKNDKHTIHKYKTINEQKQWKWIENKGNANKTHEIDAKIKKKNIQHKTTKQLTKAMKMNRN